MKRASFKTTGTVKKRLLSLLLIAALTLGVGSPCIVSAEEYQEEPAAVSEMPADGSGDDLILASEPLTGEGKTVRVTVRFEDAEIPEGAQLEVTELQEGDEGWFNRSVQLADVLSNKFGNVTLSDARSLHIRVLVNGEEYTPKGKAQVRIEYLEPLSTADTAEEVLDALTGEIIAPKARDNRFAAIAYQSGEAVLIENDNTFDAEAILATEFTAEAFADYDLVYMYDYESYAPGDDYDPSATIRALNDWFTESKIDTKASKSPTLRAGAKAADEPTRAVGSAPEHKKRLDDNGNGTYTISLDVTGEADTTGNTASNANVIIIYDTSTSMVAPGTDFWGRTDAERNNYVPMATGGRGIDKSGNYVTSYSDGLYFQLYRSNNSGNYTALTDDSYSGTVYRRTSNGYTPYTGQRYSYSIDRADASEKVVYDFTTALFSYQNQDDPTNIQAAFITFDGSAVNQTNGWTSNASAITNRVSSTGAANSAKLSYNNYTNWTAALTMAENIINSSATDDDPTYVVFITDGRPQTSSESGAQPNYNTAKAVARRIESACDETGGALYGIFAFANDDDWLASLLYYAYNGTDHSPLGETFDTEGYYKASDTAALTQAINEIFQKIVQTLGITNVSMSDGTTSSVDTSTGVAHLLDVNEDSYQYWLSIPVTAGDGGTTTFTMPDRVTSDPVTYTVTQSGSNVTITWTDPSTNSTKEATYSGSVNFNTLKLQWLPGDQGKTPFYNYGAPAASFSNSAVNWNLNSVGTLLDGVTYTVTFECYPSQETLDLIADLKNGDVTYGDTAYGDVWNYIDEDYKLKTNTSATLTYSDTRPGGTSGTTGFTNPDPEPVNATESLAVSKTWNNTLDSQEGWKSAVKLYVKRDGEEVHEVTLNSSNNWSASSFISFGILTEDSSGGNVVLKTTGHDYTFSEEAVVGHNWELRADTVRPMLINSVPTTLKLIEAADAPSALTSATTANAKASADGKTYYKLTFTEGNQEVVKYYVVEEGEVELTATNHRRSYLDVAKVVEGNNVPEGDKFPFTIKVDIANADAYDISNVNSDAWLWFSIWDTKAGAMLTDPDAATAEGMRWQLTDESVVATKPTANFNGYFCVPSGTPISIGMKTNYSLRFLNLPEGTTYTVTESDTMPADGYTFKSIAGTRSYDESGKIEYETDDEGNIIYYDDEGSVTTAELGKPKSINSDWTSEVTGTVSGKSITGTIENYESAYKVTVTNTWTTIDVKLKKVDENGAILDGSTFELTRSGALVGSYSPDSTDSEVGNPIDFGGLGVGIYKLSETTAPEHYKTGEDVTFEVYKDGSSLKARLGGSSSNASISQSGTADDPIYTITVSNERQTYDIAVQKRVTGRLGDRNKEFEIQVVSDLAMTSTDTKVTLSSDGKTATFKLKDTQYVSLTIPDGAKITVSETNAEGYTTTYQFEATGSAAATITPTDYEITDEGKIIVTNSNDVVPDTGVNLNEIPFIVLLGISAFCGAIMLLNRKKRSYGA